MFELGVWTEKSVNETTRTVPLPLSTAWYLKKKFSCLKKCEESSRPVKQLCCKIKLILLNSFEILK